MSRTSTRSRDILGLPNLSGKNLFVASTAVDSLATGLVFAFLLVYFERVTELSLVAIGGALSMGRFLAIPLPPFVGILIDKFGSRRVVIAGNISSFLGLLVCALATRAFEVAAGQFLSQLGITAYWTSNRGLVEIASDGTERRRWYAFVGALRNVGLGFGSVVTALFLSFGSPTTLRVVLAVSGISFLAAAFLISRWRIPRDKEFPEATESDDDSGGSAKAGSYLDVIRDIDYGLLLGINVTFVLSAMALPLVITVYVTDFIHSPAWYAGVLVVINTVLVALLNNPVAGRTEKHEPLKVVSAAAVVNIVGFGLFALAGGEISVAVAVALLLGAIIAYSLAEVISTPPLSELSISLSQKRIAGRYQGLFQLSWNVGMAVSPVLFAALLTIGPFQVWIALASASAIAIALSGILAARLRRRSEAEEQR